MTRKITASCIITIFTLLLNNTYAAPSVNLVTGERVPYIGVNLLNKGYVYQVVVEAFRLAGYQAKISFYPWARTTAMVSQGEADGILPVYQDAFPDNEFLFSDPFPGDTIGLLKRKYDGFQYPVSPEQNLSQALSALDGKKVGLVRGGFTLPELKKIPNINIEAVTRDLQNLDKLAGSRIQFVLIDKFTAADLMVSKRPYYIGQLEFVQPALTRKNFHIAFSKKSESAITLLAAFNSGLAIMRQDGTLVAIQSQHGLQANPPSSPTKTQLTIGTVNNPDMAIMQELATTFEKENPDIELEWKVMEENTLRRRLLSDIAIADGQFDIMTIGTYETPIWAKQGWLTQLKDLPENYNLHDILPSLLEALSYNQHLYALPFYAESVMTFYRKDLFDNANLTMPKQPTFQDIERFAEVIHNPQQKIYGICLRGKAGWGENMALITSLVNAFGGRWFDQQWNPQLTSPEWKNALTYYTRLMQFYAPPNAENNGFNENLKLFSQGHCGMWIDATVAAGLLFNPKLSKVSKHLGFAQAPSSVIPSNWLWAWSLAIPASSKNKEAAKKFITWATSQEYIKLVAQSKGWISVPPGTRKSTYETKTYQQVAPFAGFVLNAIEGADILHPTVKPTPYTGIQYVGIPEFTAIGALVGQNISEILQGKSTIDKALTTSQNFVYKQMVNSGYLK
ncbi:extracellular solute-binding protein [Zooshikella sp. RANM57]|uniref:extracellular solute-binding protein n=1 Tax=Zooshikella sp. RANM57 TaxID=3425863 RepID=UPI003D6DE883